MGVKGRVLGLGFRGFRVFGVLAYLGFRILGLGFRVSLIILVPLLNPYSSPYGNP